MIVREKLVRSQVCKFRMLDKAISIKHHIKDQRSTSLPMNNTSIKLF